MKIRTILKIIAAVAGAIIAVILGRRAARLVDRLMPDDSPKRWAPIPGDEDHVMVETSEGRWESVKNPAGVKTKDIKNVGQSETTGTVKIEIKHEATNRRGSTNDAINGSAWYRSRETDGSGG